MQYDKDIALNILNRVQLSIEHIEERAQPYSCGDDFLMSSTGVAILDSIIIAHHYFEVDADQIWWIIENELQPLKNAVCEMILSLK